MRAWKKGVSIVAASMLLPGLARATGFSIDQVVVNSVARAELGSGFGGGDSCTSWQAGAHTVVSGPCQVEQRVAGQQSTEIPGRHGASVGVNLGAGTNSVSARAYSELELRTLFPGEAASLEPGTFLFGEMRGSTRINDADSSVADHPSAAASVSVDQFFDITVPTDPLFLRVRMLVSSSRYGTGGDGLFNISKVATGENLFTLSEPSATFEEVDLSEFAGQQLRISFEANLGIAGPDNFRTSDTFPFGRAFSEGRTAAFFLIQVPEPGTFVLVGSGLVLMGARRLRRL